MQRSKECDWFDCHGCFLPLSEASCLFLCFMSTEIRSFGIGVNKTEE